MTDLVEHLIRWAAPFCGCQQICRTLRTVPCPLGGCDNHCARAVCLLRTVIEPVRTCDHGAVLVIVHGDRPTEVDCVRIALCIRVEAQRVGTELATGCAVVDHV